MSVKRIEKSQKFGYSVVLEEELEAVKKSRMISKRNSVTGKLENIPINNIRIIKTILI